MTTTITLRLTCICNQSFIWTSLLLQSSRAPHSAGLSPHSTHSQRSTHWDNIINHHHHHEQRWAELSSIGLQLTALVGSLMKFTASASAIPLHYTRCAINNSQLLSTDRVARSNTQSSQRKPCIVCSIGNESVPVAVIYKKNLSNITRKLLWFEITKTLIAA